MVGVGLVLVGVLVVRVVWLKVTVTRVRLLAVGWGIGWIDWEEWDRVLAV